MELTCFVLCLSFGLSKQAGQFSAITGKCWLSAKSRSCGKKYALRMFDVASESFELGTFVRPIFSTFLHSKQNEEGNALAALSSGIVSPCIEETGAMGLEIEFRQGIGW
jgi:hypothetical protein